LGDLLAITTGELLADVLDHQDIGMASGVSVMSSASLDSRAPPQQAQVVGPGTNRPQSSRGFYRHASYRHKGGRIL
jgi:hypothetical protein